MVILAVEDELSESVCRKLLFDDADIRCLAKRGFGHLKARLGELVSAARTATVLFMVDLDRAGCAPSLKQDWIGRKRLPPRFVFRVAVREVEAWLLADREAFAAFLGISTARIERNTEEIVDPKRRLLELARHSKRVIRSGLLPEQYAGASQGPEYNELLCKFVERDWSTQRAASNNASLQRMVSALARSRDTHRPPA
jgi:hypothetical protein